MTSHVMGRSLFALKIAPFSRVGIWTPSNTLFLEPAEVHIPKGNSTVSAVFAGLMIVTDRQTDRSRYPVCSNRLHLGSAAIRPNNRKQTNFLSYCFADAKIHVYETFRAGDLQNTYCIGVRQTGRNNPQCRHIVCTMEYTVHCRIENLQHCNLYNDLMFNYALYKT